MAVLIDTKLDLLKVSLKHKALITLKPLAQWCKSLFDNHMDLSMLNLLFMYIASTKHSTILSKPLGKQLSLANGEPLFDPTLYRSTIGALQYVTLTHLDISFVVNKACQFMYFPTIAHWCVVKRILRYLKRTSSYGLLLQHHVLMTIKAPMAITYFSNPIWPHGLPLNIVLSLEVV
ncbi:hypothetical protein AAG906_020719 [Vitis piasezkii]